MHPIPAIVKLTKLLEDLDLQPSIMLKCNAAIQILEHTNRTDEQTNLLLMLIVVRRYDQDVFKAVVEREEYLVFWDDLNVLITLFKLDHPTLDNWITKNNPKPVLLITALVQVHLLLNKAIINQGLFPQDAGVYALATMEHILKINLYLKQVCKYHTDTITMLHNHST